MEQILHRQKIASADLDALVVFYPFSRSMLDEERERWQYGLQYTPNLRTSVHERQHLIQAVSTTWGSFRWRLCDAQADAISIILRILRDENIPIRPPVSLQLDETNFAALPARIREEEMLWYEIESLIALESGSIDASLYSNQRSALLRREGTLLALFQSAILRSYEVRLKVGAQQGWPIMTPSVMPDLDTIYSYEKLDSSARTRRARLGLQDIAGKVGMSDTMNSTAVMESGALAAELVGCGELLFDILARTTGPGHIDDTPYIFPLRETARHLQGQPASNILATHMALCDIALMTPVLPTLHRFRAGQDLRDLLPFRRFFTALKGLSHGTSLAEGDFNQFVEHTCDRLGWASPRTLARSWVGGNRPPTHLDPRDELLDHSMTLRCSSSSIFSQPSLGIAGPANLLNALKPIQYPIIQWSDQVTYLSNKEALNEFRTAYVWGQWLRQLFLGEHVEITLPWSARREEIDILQSDVGQIMESLLAWKGAPLPKIIAQGQP